MEIFLIEKGWIDPMENDSDRAVGYELYGYMKNEKEAKEFCQKHGYWTKENCWAIGMFDENEKMPKFRYQKLEPIKNNE